MDQLPVGKVLRTKKFSTVRVEKYLGEGGQGAVYLVDCDGEKKALKWYKKNGMGKDPAAFRENIEDNIKRHSPSPEFLWPQDVTEWENGTFGYIMDLRPDDYFEVTEFMLRHVTFRSFRAVVDAALHIVSAFRILHNKGYTYVDVNNGNFFINPKNGKVLICDNDNVAPEGTETGVDGKPRYMAPEIVTKKSRPNTLSDRYSMSLMIYILLCLNHPLEGRRYLKGGLTIPEQEDLYGFEPIFMMDPNDKRNAPHPVAHHNTLVMWNCLPDYMRKIFLDAFSKEALMRPAARPKEIDWLNVLTRFRSEIVPCSCGNEIFVSDGRPCPCDGCGKMARITHRLVLSEYSIPVVRDTRIYRCQIGVCDADMALKPVAQVLERSDAPGKYGVRNKTDRRWDAATAKGTPRKVAPDEVIPVIAGITFTVDSETVRMEEN